MVPLENSSCRQTVIKKHRQVGVWCEERELVNTYFYVFFACFWRFLYHFCTIFYFSVPKLYLIFFIKNVDVHSV